MKRFLLAFLAVLMIVSGCTVTKQSLIKELGSNPDTELASLCVDFFQNYDKKPATQIELTYEDDTTVTVNDPILIQRFYRYITNISVKAKSTAADQSGEIIRLALDNGTLVLPMEFVGDALVLGNIAYELADASVLLQLVRQIKEGTTPVHVKKSENYTARIDSLVQVGNSLTADLEFVNTSEEDIDTIEATVIFVDKTGKIMATKKINTKLENPLEPKGSYWIAVSCDYKDTIDDVTFQD